MDNPEREGTNIQKNFIGDIIERDMQQNSRDIQTRFPPEPNGYLHIGHAKSIVLNFDLASHYQGSCNLRLDDTNPTKEEARYVAAIQQDIIWLGYDWEERLYYASDYFEQLYQYAVQLVEKGKAYVDSLSAEQIRQYRGTPTEPGRDSPYRERSVAENLQLLAAMRDGEFPEGRHVLRAMIDMAHSSLTMRDPTMYRIRKVPHHRTGKRWVIYPMYDFAHCLSDAIEGISHSLCTIEFEEHRPLYDWFLRQLEIPAPPRQIEFAPLNLSHTLLSKRRLKELVQEKMVSGWDDPRMPTISGMRRRGYPAAAIRNFCRDIGVTKTESVIDSAHLDFFVRKELNQSAPRVMAVLRPLRVVLENWPEDRIEEIPADNNPEDPQAGSRLVPFGRVLYIERDDFLEHPPKKFFRLSPNSEVRLKHAYYITCKEVIKDEAGEIVELRCHCDMKSLGGSTADGRVVKGTLHWVSAAHAISAEIRLYDRLFTVANPGHQEHAQHQLSALINPDSIVRLPNCQLEPSLTAAVVGQVYQFLRLGYFCLDSVDSRPDNLVFNRVIALRDSWPRRQSPTQQMASKQMASQQPTRGQ